MAFSVFFFFLNENVNVVVCKVELEVASFTLMKACTRFYQAQRPHSNFICYYFLIISNRYLMSACQVKTLKDMNILKNGMPTYICWCFAS